MERNKDYFEGIVGQDVAKAKLSFLMKSYEATSILPHLMFVAPKGCGKTTLAKAVAKNLKNAEGGTKKFLRSTAPRSRVSSSSSIRSSFHTFTVTSARSYSTRQASYPRTLRWRCSRSSIPIPRIALSFPTKTSL